MIEGRELRAAREVAGVEPALMANLVDVEESDILSLEEGKIAPDVDTIDRYARVLGVSVERFLSDDPGKAPAVLLFRALSPDAIGELADGAAHFWLGDFLRCAEDAKMLASVRARHGERVPSPLEATRTLRPVSPPDNDQALYHQAESLAADVRACLALGDGPVGSMISIFEDRLRVPIVWVTPTQLDQNIDGASTLDPYPAVLVNLVGGRDCWWRTRMTLAHELCHLLFDSLVDDSGRRLFLFSPNREKEARRSRGRRYVPYVLPERLERMERRANAFAAHFLAPANRVRQLVSRADATSENAITLVCQHFQIGRVTAINQLTNVFVLSPQERSRMIDRDASESLPVEHPDANVPPGTGLRSGLVQHWARDALARSWISRVHAGDLLGVPATQALPMHEGLTNKQTAPVLDEARAALLRAEAFLGSDASTVRLHAREAVADGNRWRVSVFESQPDGTESDRGEIVLSRSLESLEHESSVTGGIQ